MSYIKYLTELPNGYEVYNFDEQSDADAFGNKLREIIQMEEGIGRWDISEIVDIDISRLTVRTKLKVDVDSTILV